MARSVSGFPGFPDLPDADADLSPLLARTVPGSAAQGWPGRGRDLGRHLAQLRPEFGGRSEAAWLLAVTIVRLRRDPQDARAAALFGRLTAEHGAVLAGQLTLRWLIAVCDTVADLPAATLAERGLAMTGAAMANLVKLAETERRLYHPPRPWPPRRRFAVGHEMFDGLKAFSPGRGDMIQNLTGRLAALLEDAETAGLPIAAFVAELLMRLMTPDTVLGRFAMIQGEPRLPLVGDDLRQALARLTDRL